MCQNCFHARKASNVRLVPVTPKAEKKVALITEDSSTYLVLGDGCESKAQEGG